MEMRYLAIGTLVSLSAVASAQVLTTTGGDYFVIATSQAHTVTDGGSESGFSGTSSFSRSRSSSASYNDPDLGLQTAASAGNLLWNTTTSGGTTTVSGGGGGYAEGMSTGLETYASGGGSVAVYFTVHVDATAVFDSQGTYSSDLWRYDGTEYVAFQTGWNGTDTISLPTGMYRVNASGGETISGSAYYSSGTSFSIAATAVPEPSSLLLLGGMASFFIRRRR